LRSEKKYVASDIQYHLNSAITGINKEATIGVSEEGILPYGMRIQWTKETTPESFVRENELIVRMDFHTNQDRNLTIATMLYLSKGLVPHSRRYIYNDILRSLDLTIGKKIIKDNPVSLQYFLEEILDKESEEVLNYCGYLDDIDRAGFFTRVLLREFKSLGLKLYPRQIRDQEIPNETKDFVKFLREIAIKPRDIDVPLDFPGSKIKVGICLVAKPWKRDILPYCNRIEKYLRDKDIDEIYILAAGKDNIKLVKNIIKLYNKHPLIQGIKKQEYNYEDYRDTGRTYPGICSTVIKGIIPNTIKILIQTLEEKDSLVAASLTSIIRKKKGLEKWPKPEFKDVYSCLDKASDMSLITIEDCGGDKKITLKKLTFD